MGLGLFVSVFLGDGGGGERGYISNYKSHTTVKRKAVKWSCCPASSSHSVGTRPLISE